MSECSPLLMEDGATWFDFESGPENLFVLEISNDCSILFQSDKTKSGGGTIVPDAKFYTPIPERILWLKVRFKDREWKHEINLLNSLFYMHNNNKVSAMFKPNAPRKQFTEVKAIIKKATTLTENITATIKNIGINSTKDKKK